MWRRLVWQVLGRLYPSAQEWFVRTKDMCVHNNDYQGGWALVLGHIARNIWSDPSGGGLSRELLFCQQSLGDAPAGKDRYFYVKHYARAANLAYCQTYSNPAAVLLSQQVLIALSPLHQQTLPEPTVAALCPSNAGAAAGKVLMQKLGVGQAFWDFRHEGDVQPSMWHVWWHTGIRRYHHMKQQQQACQQCSVARQAGQQQQQVQQEEGFVHGSAFTGRGVTRLSPQRLQDLYNDPDARYYAVGFAGRQLAPSQQPSQAAAMTYQQIFIKGVTAQLVQVCHNVRVTKLAANNLRFHRSAHMAATVLSQQCRDADIISRVLAEQLQGSDRKDLIEGAARHGTLSDITVLLLSDGQHAIAAAGGRQDLVCQIVSGVADSGHVQQAALLVPTASNLWVHPREWCRVRAAAMQDELCSWCEQQPGIGAEGLFDLEGWLQDKVSSQELCPKCHTFFCCSRTCAANTFVWHRAVCSTLTKCRQRYIGTHPSSSSSRVDTGSRGPGYRWHVLDLLECGRQPLREPGPLGVDCLGLLTAQHDKDGVLVLADRHWRKAREQFNGRHLEHLSHPGVSAVPGLRGLLHLDAEADPVAQVQQVLQLMSEPQAGQQFQ